MAEIQPLPREVAAQIRSSCVILSLSDVIIGLLENSLDAVASRVDISLDLGRASCSVEDDGHGIVPADFEVEGGLGKPFHTSDLDADPVRLGSHGAFLSSVAAVSILSISSRHRAHRTANTLTIHNSVPIARHIPAPPQLVLLNREHGTKVVVYDLFGNLPVRVKQRPTEERDWKMRDREWAHICRNLTGVALAAGRPLWLTVKGTDKSHAFRIRTLGQVFALPQDLRFPTLNSSFDLALILSTLCQAAGVKSSALGEWIRTSARINAVTVRAAISLEPAPSRNTQYICIENRFLPPDKGYDIVYDTINQRFMDSSFGIREESPRKRESSLGPTNKELKGAGRGVDRWPSFFIRIELSESSQRNSSRSPSPYDSSQLSEISKIIAAMITSFLEEHHFRTGRQSRKKQSMPIRKPHEIVSARQAEDDRRRKSCSGSPILDSNNISKRGILNDLDSAAKFPRPEKMQASFDLGKPRLSSRVKMSTSYKPKPGGLEPQKAVNAETKPRKLRNEESEGLQCCKKSGSTAQADDEVAPVCSDGRAVPSTGDKDGTIQWAHPVNKEILTINARTGCVIDPLPFRRPATTDGSGMEISRRRIPTLELPRLTRSSSGLVPPKDGSWASSFFKGWENPVFQNSEESIRQVCLEGLEFDSGTWKSNAFNDANFKDSASMTSMLCSKLSKSSLRDVNVISQVDSKFILASLDATSPTEFQASGEKQMLVLIDQHASDERVRVEALLAELCTPATGSTRSLSSPLGHKSSIETVQLEKPLFFELHLREHALFRKSAAYFARWGILYDLVLAYTGLSSIESQKVCRLVVLTLPAGIAERCRAEPKHLIELLRGEAWKLDASKPVSTSERDSPSSQTEDTGSAWLCHIHNCPQGILDLINSRACRSAIMFNDDLSLQQCRELVRKLADCHFPFQCAHGRPTMVPLVELGALQGMGTDAGLGGVTPRAGRQVDFVQA